MKSIKKPIAIVLAVVIILGTCIVAFLTKGFGIFASPVDGLISAFRNTVKKENLSIKFSITGTEDDYTWESEEEMRIVFDSKKKELTYITSDDDDHVSLFHDGEVYSLSSSYARHYEDEDTAENFLDVYDALSKKKKDADWENIIEKFYMDDYVDGDNVDDFLKTFYKDYLCDKEWLEDNLGFEKESKSGVTTYSFEGDLKDIIEAMVEVFKETDLCKKDFLNELEDLGDELDGKLELSMSVKGGKLQEINIYYADGYAEYDINVEFFDIGKTEITEEEIEDIKDDVDEWIDDHTCPDCGEVYSGDECWFCNDY